MHPGTVGLYNLFKHTLTGARDLEVVVFTRYVAGLMSIIIALRFLEWPPP